MIPASAANQISYESFCLLGGVRNPDLHKVHRSNGNHHYTTYHIVSIGGTVWKNSKQLTGPGK